jgi:hypothetical protein
MNSKTVGELEAGKIAGTLTEEEAADLDAITTGAIDFCRRFYAGFDELIRSVDPHGRKNPMAAIIVAGRRRCISIFDSEEFLSDLAKRISQDIDTGKTGFMQDMAELTGKSEVENRQCCYLTALLEFRKYEERWPTKRESEESALGSFPDIFRDVDEKEWRRIRKQLRINWLANDPRRTKRGA